MEAEKFTKDRPAYLYRLIRSSHHQDSTDRSFDRFIVAKAWDSSLYGTTAYSRFFDYKDANGRFVRDVRTDKNPGVLFTEARGINIWFRERNDSEALRLCKEWLNKRNVDRAREIRRQTFLYMADRAFTAKLVVTDESK